MVWRYLTIALAAIIATSCSRRTPEPGAASEVVLYSSVDEPYLRPILKRFEEQSKVHVRLVTDGEATKTAGLAERLEAERSNPRADVYWGNEIFHTIRLADAGVFDAYRPPPADGIPPKWRDATDRFIDIGLRVRLLGISTRDENRRLAANIKGVADLVRPDLKDRIGMSNPGFGTASGHVAALYVALGPEKFKALMQGLRNNHVKLLGGNSIVAEQVAGGNLVAGLTDNDDLDNAKADGGKIEGVPPDQSGVGTLLVPTTVALVKGAPHADAGRKLIDFLAAPDVEAELIKAKFLAYSTRSEQVPVRAMSVDYPELSRQMPEAVRAAMEILPMKIAFSTSIAPGWDIEEAIACAKRLDVEGIELDLPPEDPTAASRAARQAGIELACLGTSAAFAGTTVDDMVSGGVVQADIDSAAEMGCRLVRMRDIAAGKAHEPSTTRFGDFLLPLADYALERDIALVVENALSLRTARAMWAVMDRLSHPALGVAWDATSAMLAGESPHQSVPVLNTRIRHVRLYDARHGQRVQLGDGETPIRPLLTRLRGVGYSGFLSLTYPDLAEPEEFLKESVRRLREWTRPAVVKGKPAVAPKVVPKAAGGNVTA